VELGCVLLDEANSGWMAKSKVVLDYKLEHTNKELDGRLTCQRGESGCLNTGRPPGLGRPAWGPPHSSKLDFSLAHSSLLCCFVTMCSTGCTAQTLSSTHFLALLVLPLDVFALSHFHTLCLTCLHDIPAKQGLVCPHACPLHVALMKDVGGASRDASWCMHG
jgi:hypothetical protein